MSSVLSALEGAAVGIAVGEAASTVLEPALEAPRQEAWKKSQARILELGQLAELVAQALQSFDDVLDDAERNGFARDQLEAAIQLAVKAPSPLEVVELWRRNGIVPEAAQVTPTQIDHALAKSGLEYQYWPAVKARLTLPNPPELIARGIHRGIYKDPGFLPVGPPSAVGKVAAFPMTTLDPLAEAMASGIDRERLFVETAIVGLPMALDQAARATFRGILEPVDFDRAVAESNFRNEWGPFLFDVARQIPTALEFVENRIRGWSDDDAMHAGTARHGMSVEDTQLLFENAGRPLSHNLVLIGLLRGGTYNGPTDQIDPTYLISLQHSSMRPEYYNLAWAGRFHFPPFFQTVQLLKAGSITAATATEWLTIQAYDPDAIKTVIDNVSGPTSSAGTSATRSATTTALTTVRKAYTGGAIDQATAAVHLTALKIPADDQPGVFNAWDVIRAVENAGGEATTV